VKIVCVGIGVTVSEADFEAPKTASISAVVLADTAVVVAVNVATVWPAATMTTLGTPTTVDLLETVTFAPDGGAGAESTTVPVDDVPPITLAGFIATDVRLTLATASASAPASDSASRDPRSSSDVARLQLAHAKRIVSATLTLRA